MPVSRGFNLGKRLGQLSLSLTDDGTIAPGTSLEASVQSTAAATALDSAAVISLISSNAVDTVRDSAFVSGIVDSAYITALGFSAGGGGADLSTIDITDIAGTDGNPGDLLQSLGNGLVGWQSDGSLTYSLKVTYSTLDVDSVQDLPTGWTIDSQGTTFITLSHNTGKTLKDVSYLSYNTSANALQLNKIANKEHATAPVRQPTEKVTLKVDATTTNTSSNQFTYVNLVF